MKTVCRNVCLWLLTACPLALVAQMTLRVTQVPQYYMPLLDDIYVAGTFNGWEPNFTPHRLTKQPDGSYQVVISGLANGSPMEFKLTRGSWATVESTANGTFLPNRTATYSNGTTLTLSVAGWEDFGAPPHTVAGRVQVLSSQFDMPPLGRKRRVWLYLPPSYDTSPTTYYPVVYMHDGQNVFDAATSFSGEWGVDEALEGLADDNQQQAIVVAIDNGGTERINEYSPWVNATYGGGQGDEYMDFIVNYLKPYIDAHYRTLSGRDYTALIGSSMGALVSYYGGLQYQQVFSKVGIFSPAFWFAPEVLNFATTTGRQAPMRLYFVAANTESSSMAPNIQTVRNNLLAAGFSASELNVQIRPTGAHSEWFWRQEFPAAFIWLFANIPTDIATIEEAKPEVTLLRNGNTYFVQYPPDSTVRSVHMYNAVGQLVRTYSRAVEQLNFDDLPRGTYLVHVVGDTWTTTQRLVH